MNEEKQLLVYIHIPKTGGTTLKNIISKQFLPKEVWLHMEKDTNRKMQAKRKIDQLRCIGGHCWYGVHDDFDRPYKYFTMLRNPFDRVISEYYYILRWPEHKAYPQVRHMSFLEFIHQFPLKSSNQQTRRISGSIHDPDLKIAKNNLKKDFAIAGLAEMFDESLFLMKKAFNWNNITYSKQNVTPNRPAIDDMPKEILQELERRNEMDLELYSFAKKLLKEKLEGLDSISKQELELFKLGNQS
jgi:hypothetical protein